MRIFLTKLALTIVTNLELKVKAMYDYMMVLDKKVTDLQKRIGPRPVYKSGDKWDWATWGCPGCGGKEIYEGPCGGASQNICCANQTCQRAFNLMLDHTEDIGNHAFKSNFEPAQERFGQWAK